MREKEVVDPRMADLIEIKNKIDDLTSLCEALMEDHKQMTVNLKDNAKTTIRQIHKSRY